MHNQIDAIGRGIGMAGKPVADLCEPVDKALRGPLVERRQVSTTRSGPDARNIGAATAGRRRFAKRDGNGM
jgi:hypothetical protein